MKRICSILIIVKIISFSIFSSQVHGKSCFKIKKDSIQIKWTAFKTPLKVGVSGLLKKIQLTEETKQKRGDSIVSILKDVSFTILTDKKSVDSRDAARDNKISRFIFSTLKNNGTIEGVITSVTTKKILINLTLNGITKTLPLQLSINDLNLKAKGVIDLFDFSMSKEVQALNKACLAKHEGKTWSDVQVELKAEFLPCSP